MIKKVVILSVLTVGSFAFAQKVDVNVGGVPADSDETTIQIKKGKADQPAKAEDSKPHYEVSNETDDVVGEGGILLKQAQANWKKACDKWTIEMKAQSTKDNQIILPKCGAQKCASEGNETVCRSQGTYKLKVKLE